MASQLLHFQSDFLDNENGSLKPLTMAKVAGLIGVHETTVSRAIANKYVKTPRGLFEMKHFFKSGYKCADGSALTPEAVKERIADLIDKEKSEQPLKDIDLVNIFADKGLKIARRTIAKYRDEMNIPSSKTRKRLANFGNKHEEFTLPAQALA